MRNKIIKFFINLIFRDFIKEKNTLQTRLKEICNKEGFPSKMKSVTENVSASLINKYSKNFILTVLKTVL